MYAEEIIIITIIISKPSYFTPLLAKLSALPGYVILPVLWFLLMTMINKTDELKSRMIKFMQGF